MSMMEDVLLNAKSAVSSVGQKAGRVIDRSKLRLAAIDIKSELSKKYRMLGKICYEASRKGKNYDDEIGRLCENISELNEHLEAVTAVLASAEKKIKCGDCGEYNHKDAVFCNQCGAKLTKAKDADEDYSKEELLDYAEEISDEEIG